jgi:uncharacterized protein YkwD
MSVRLRQGVAVAVIGLALLWSVGGERIQELVNPDEAGCAHSGDVPDPGNADETRDAVLCLVNRHRVDAGLPPLVEDAALEAAAQAHAADMGERDFFAHRSPGGGEPDRRMRRAGYDGRTTGENLAWGTGLQATPASIVEGWMASPGHRANILHRSFTHVGTGIAHDAPEPAPGADPGVYVQNFGG